MIPLFFTCGCDGATLNLPFHCCRSPALCTLYHVRSLLDHASDSRPHTIGGRKVIQISSLNSFFPFLFCLGHTPYRFLSRAFTATSPLCRCAPFFQRSRRTSPRGISSPMVGIQLSRCISTKLILFFFSSFSISRFHLNIALDFRQ